MLRISSVISKKWHKHQEMFHKPGKSNILATEGRPGKEIYGDYVN